MVDQPLLQFEEPIGGVPRRSGRMGECRECHGPFLPYRRAEGRQVYCSEKCRRAAWGRIHPSVAFEPHKLARAEDPDTSKAAARAARDLRECHHGIILDVLLGGPKTSEEIAAASSLRHDQVWRRAGELRDKGYIKDTGDRRPNASGRPATVWALADEAL